MLSRLGIISERRNLHSALELAIVGVSCTLAAVPSTCATGDPVAQKYPPRTLHGTFIDCIVITLELRCMFLFFQGERGLAGEVGPLGRKGAKGQPGDQGPAGNNGVVGPAVSQHDKSYFLGVVCTAFGLVYTFM